MADGVIYDEASDANRPQPRSAEGVARWEETGLRHRMLCGKWREDARRALYHFFDDDTLEFLPPPFIGFCAFKEYVNQTATLYDGAVAVKIKGREPSDARAKLFGMTKLWAQQEDTLRFVRGLRDCYVCRSWDDVAGMVRYRVVTPDCIDAEATGPDPQQPTIVRELRRRKGIYATGFDPDREYWCWDVWDFSRKGSERFSIMFDPGENDDEWVDVTLAVMPELAGMPGRLMYWSEVVEVTSPDGSKVSVPAEGATPIWPWTAYHHRISSHLHDPYTAIELVDGTLSIAVLWTFWLGGFRDVAFAQRWLKDADIAATNLDPVHKTPYAKISPAAVIKIKSAGDMGGGEVGQWESAMEPATAAKSIADLAASLGLHAGLSPADVSVGNSGLSRTSGFAIEVSRSGVRRIEGKVVTPMRLGDQHNLAGAAEFINAYSGTTGLPTDPESYTIIYTRQGQTTEEIRAEVEEVTTLVERGLMHPRDAVRRLNPHMTDKEAEEYLLEIAEFSKALASVRGPATEARQAQQDEGGDNPPQDDPEEDPEEDPPE